MMQRTPEPELMDTPEQTQAYAQADFSEPNTLFCQALHENLSQTSGRLIDLGCGSGGLLVQIAQTLPDWNLMGVDAGPNMLSLAQQAIDAEHLGHRVQLIEAHLPSEISSLCDHSPFDVITSNSVLHHLSDPMTLWQSIQALGQSGTTVVVMDLHRPDSINEVEALVDAHTQGAHEVLKQDFRNSLCAAWRLDEVKDQLSAQGWSHWLLTKPSNRHWLAIGQL